MQDRFDLPVNAVIGDVDGDVTQLGDDELSENHAGPVTNLVTGRVRGNVTQIAGDYHGDIVL